MKLMKLKGIAHDLVLNLDFRMQTSCSDPILPYSLPINRNVLIKKDKFDKYCISFFKERLPKTFDFNKIDEIRVKIIKTVSPSVKIKIVVKVDKMVFEA